MTTTDPRREFSKAIATASPVIAAVRPDQLEGPTPCPEMTVAQLLDHLLLVIDRVTALGRDGDGTTAVHETRREGWSREWESRARAGEAAWADDDSLTRVVVLPWTKMTGADALSTYVSEVTVHTWDLATATGQHPRWDPGVVEVSLEAMHRELPAEGRMAALEEAVKRMPPGAPMSFPFAEAVAVADSAPLIDQLIGFTGRQPARAGAELSAERADILALLGAHRDFLRFTVRGLSDEEASRRTTVSALCLAGILKHVTAVERQWANFIVQGASAIPSLEEMYARHADQFRVLEGETLAGLLAAYDRVAARTDDLVAALPDLDLAHPLPEAPWFEPGASWTARRAVLHIVAETAQHAGHADIIREALDGQKTMG
jgi:uncharacterized protein (TIGR03086 family)